MMFERGKDPKQSMGIGGHRKDLNKGDYFLLRFRIRESTPAYYPFQKREREGKFAEGYVLDPDFAHYHSWGRRIKCVVNGIPHETFYARWNDDEELWVVE